MEAANEESQWKSINEIAYLGTAAHMLADERFPADCTERRLLLKISDAMQQLWSVHFGLESTIKHIDEMRRLSLDEQLDVMDMSLMLERMAFDCGQGSQKQSILERAASLMHSWYELSYSFDHLRSVSEPFRNALHRHKLNG